MVFVSAVKGCMVEFVAHEGITNRGERMTEKRKTNMWWPDVSTLEAARQARMYGVWAAAITALLTSLLAAWSLGAGKEAFGFVDAWAFLDAAMFAAIGFGIYKGSRFAALAGLILFVAEKILQVAMTGKLGGFIMAFLFVLLYITAVRATFALHRLRAAGPTSNAS